MLKFKYLFENYNLAKYCLMNYDYDDETVDQFLTHFRISSNAVYPFKTPDGKVCFLRLSPVDEKSAVDASSVMELVSWLKNQGFNVMKPHPMKNGKLIDHISTIWGEYNVSCYELVEGESLEDSKHSPDIIKGYGKCLASLHNRLVNYPKKNSLTNHENLLKRIQERLTKYQAPKKLLDEVSDVEFELSLLEPTKENYGVVHYDFEPDNVFYDEASNKFSVIDFDDAILCYYALDIARAIDALDDVRGDIPFNDAKCLFLEGYRDVRAFSSQDEETIPLMRRLVALDSYAPFLPVESEEISDSPDWLLEIKEKLNAKNKKIEDSVIQKRIKLIPAYKYYDNYIDGKKSFEEACINPFKNKLLCYAPFDLSDRLPKKIEVNEKLIKEIEELKKIDIVSLEKELNKIADNLPNFDDDPIYVALYPLDMNRKKVIDAQDGVIGASLFGNILLELSPYNDNLKNVIKYVFAHEYHHTVFGNYWYNLNNGVLKGNLFEALITDGQADTFAKLQSETVNPKWLDQDIIPYLDEYKAHFEDTKFDYVKHMFGKDSIPWCMGYAVGFKLITEYLKENKLNTLELLKTNPAKILEFFKK